MTFQSKSWVAEKSGQLDAMVLGISRALVKSKADHKPILRKAGLITRDSRERQRRMVGTGGKARRQKVFTKEIKRLYIALFCRSGANRTLVS